ncbi:MAG: nitroreductase family deazaflavin-dependent oxidoreductase [Actinomycetota bacterium]|nr:nitroreductase family deazaflavin-dependent oxidoreductase [Actinomycetota bacterium]
MIEQRTGGSAKKEAAMAYLKPPSLTRRLANPLATRLNGRGVSVLTVVGRRTGMPHKVPVIPVEVAGRQYLVSPYGESEWVRNLRAAGKGELSRKGQTQGFQAVEIPVAERGPMIARYREVAGRVVGSSFAKLPEARDHPVFQIN